MSFMDIVSKFNQQADSHSKSQSLNPFSEQFEPSRSPSPRFSREEYGKPIAGSKTDLRGRKAKSHICREILELCTVIHDVGTYNSKKREPDDGGDGEDDGTIIVSFGELFQIYTKISDKVVGLLIAAKRRGFVYFDREILFQRRDDDVLIALLKPISEISKQLKEDISQASGTTSAPTEPKQVEKKKSTSSSKAIQVKPECNKEPKVTVDHQKKVISEAAVDIVTTIGANDDHKTNCNEEVNGVVDEEVVNNIVEISEQTEDDSVREIDDKTETEKTNTIKTEGIYNETMTEETDVTNTKEIDEIKTEETNENKTDETNKVKTGEIDENEIREVDETGAKEIDETATEEIVEDGTKTDESKTELSDKTKNEDTDETITEEIDEIKTEKINETDETKTKETHEINGFSNDVIKNEIDICSLSNVNKEVQEEVEKSRNINCVEVHKNYQVDIMTRENTEEVSNGKEINIIIDIEKE